MINRAEIIKSRLTMPQVLRYYGIEAHKRIPCPIHGGDGKNFEVKERSFRCYSRCGGGDVITFVEKYFGLDFIGALRKLDSDFGLGLYERPTLGDYRRMQKAQQDRKQKKEDKDEIIREFWDVFGELARLERIIALKAPKSIFEDFDPEYCEALKKIDYQRELFEEIKFKREEAEKRWKNQI